MPDLGVILAFDSKNIAMIVVSYLLLTLLQKKLETKKDVVSYHMSYRQ